MRIGLCACYDNRNYGSMLQALATQVAIEALGHECEIIRYEKSYSLKQKIKQVPRVLNGGTIQKLKRQRARKKADREFPGIAARRKARNERFDAFRDSVFTSLSEVYVGFDKLREGSARYDCVVTGSDQLWLPIGLATNFYNLQFAKPGVRRVSYATSFGVADIPWYQRGRTADFLRKIDFLSVREARGAEICREVAGIEAKVVVDPTMLLNTREWDSVIPRKTVYPDPYIFCYFLGSNPFCRAEARKLSEKAGLPIVTLRHLDEIVPEDERFGDSAPYDIDPAGFVNLVRNAEYVVTDSFHGTVFSVINHKRFATMYRFATGDRQSRNSRIDSLLEHLGLESRLITEPDLLSSVIGADIDYGDVDKRLARWSDDSWLFLARAVS